MSAVWDAYMLHTKLSKDLYTAPQRSDEASAISAAAGAMRRLGQRASYGRSVRLSRAPQWAAREKRDCWVVSERRGHGLWPL